MWTPKRVVIFFTALIGFLLVFAVVTPFLIVFDGLPGLPKRYEDTGPGEDRTVELPPPPPEVRDLKIRQAFGNECEELKRRSLMWLSSKNAVVAFDHFNLTDDGRVSLKPFSAGLFAKSKGEVRFPEINTVQCAEAILTLDKPITSLTGLSGSKVVAVELKSPEAAIKITNNRKSQEKNDDIELYVTGGSLFYEDARSLIWSPGFILLLDTQSQPLPTQITAKGLEVVLSKDVSPNRDKKTPPPPPQQPGQKKDAVSGVEKITLLANVDMNLYIDARSGFMSGQDQKPAEKSEPVKAEPVNLAPLRTDPRTDPRTDVVGFELIKTVPSKFEARPPAQKAHVHIKTNGKFIYDLLKEHAHFDSPEQTGLAQDRVNVTRTLCAIPTKPASPVDPLVPVMIVPKAAVLLDVLDCDHLDLHFRKKPGGDGASSDKEIDHAIATAKTDAIVELHVETEEMHAFGAEMRYYAAIDTAKDASGPRTILKGSPVHAIRAGNHIRCEELHLKGADKKGNGQEAFAKGPGKIDLLDKATGKTSTHITFKTNFTSTRDHDGDRVYDLLTLRGEPVVIDEEHKSEMRAAQFMHLWVEEVKSTVKLEPGASRHRPHMLEAFERVNVRSPEMNIHDANHLKVCFREIKAPVNTGEKGTVFFPAVGGPIGAKPPIENTSTTKSKDFVPPLTNNGATLGLPFAKDAKDGKEKEKEAPKRPVELSASDILAYVGMHGNTKELQEFRAEGNVHVTQESENPKDKGLDITGNFLKLTRNPGGDTLVVFGEKRKLAQLQYNEMTLFGPMVTIDQEKNEANVDGVGAMHMPSTATGKDGKKKESHVTVHWNKSMWFNGRDARFDGGVEAFQDGGKLVAEEMQVQLDKPISFKQKDPTQKTKDDGQKAKVERIVCDSRDDKNQRPILILEEERDLKTNKISMFRRLYVHQVDVDNKEQRMDGSGPGVLDFIGLSAPGDPLQNDPKEKAKEKEKKDPGKKEEAIAKWTRVRFDGQMISYPTPTGNGRVTTFIDNVRVFHQPGDDPNLRDPNTLAKDGLYLTAHKLTVVQRKVGDKNSQEMIADGMGGMVNFQSLEFTGNAKMVKYDDIQEQIIFEGTRESPATLYKRSKIQGARPQTIQGTKILYNRKTGEFLLDGVRVIQSRLEVEERPQFALAFRVWAAMP